MILTSSQLVSEVQRAAALSSNQAGFATADILFFANLVMSDLVAEVMKVREEYIIFQDRLTVTANTSSYRIPYRAVGSALRHLWFEDSSGNRTKLAAKFEENIEDYSTTSTGSPVGFYLFANTIILLPTPNVGGTLVVTYPFRPNQLVDSSTTTAITAVNSTTSVAVSNGAAIGAGAFTIDLIDYRSGNGIVAYDQPATISGNTITFGTAQSGLVVGQYVALANQSPVMMLPEELNPMLLEMTVLRIEMARGNKDRIQNSVQRLQQAKETCAAVFNNRVISKPHPTGGGNALVPQRMWL